MPTRTERDSMGEMTVPAEALYGAQTARAVANFPISGIRFPRCFIKALGEIKRTAAAVNMELGRLDPKVGKAILQAAEEVVGGALDSHFVLDIYQTGSGTSTHMNANEVIANRACQILGKKSGDKGVHPNDQVNSGQSSNDVIPSAIHIAAADLLVNELLPALVHLHQTLRVKGKEFAAVLKIGRTHLMDATPVTLGQEISGWARQVELGVERLEGVLPRLGELTLGGTAVGTGLTTHPEFAGKVIARLAKSYGIKFTEATNHFAAQGGQDAAVELSGQLKTVAAALMKIGNDVRLLNSGPRCGIGEITVPAVQPGSSIMPGKVNPVIAEALCQVAAQVVGNDAAVTIGGACGGSLELNVMLPMIAHNLLQSEMILANVVRIFADSCMKGLKANRERAESLIEWSMAMVTALAGRIGYDKAAEIAKKAVAQKKTVKQVCLDEKILPKGELEKLLDPRTMLAPKG